MFYIKRSLFFLIQFFLFLQHADAQLKRDDYIRNYGDLDNTFYYIHKENKLTVAFLGGSITHMNGWRNLVCEDLCKSYSDVDFTFVNAGIPSLGSLPHAFRLQQDVLEKERIDLLFIESAVNDKVNGTSVKIQQRALEGIVRHARRVNPYMDIVIMAFVDLYKINDYRSGRIPAEVEIHEDIARIYKLPFINLAKEVTDRIAKGEFTWEEDFKDLHPSPFGQQLYFHTIKSLLHQNARRERGEKLEKPPLPQPMDPGNYDIGHYGNIHSAYGMQEFRIVEDWTPADHAHTREKFVHIPVLEATTPGAIFELNFNGPVIGLGVLSGPDAGILEYEIDGKAFKPVDLYTPWSPGLHLPWYLILADDLKEGNHHLKVRLSAKHNRNSKGTAARLIYFLENSNE